MSKLKVAILSAALLGGAVAVSAADPQGGSKPAVSAEKRAEWQTKREERLTSLFEKIDANKDGKLTQAELEAFYVKIADEQFAKMDASKTGAVDLTQFKAFKSSEARGKMGRHHRHGMMKKLGETK
jgi:Ca2+-binding EF-hand superfamily protein